MPDRPVELLIEGRIATLRGADGFGWVEAIAIGGGRVIGSGSRAEVAALAGPRTRSWKLGTELVVTPSLCDAHLHLEAAALAAAQLDLTALDRVAAMRLVSEAHQELDFRGDVEGWVLGHGWSFGSLGEHPLAEWLDEVAPGRPVALWAHDHHARWLSSRAVQLVGLAARADPDAGRIERDSDGRPTGILYEAAAGLPDAAVPSPDHGVVDTAIGAFARTLAALGVTSVHDPGGLAPDPELRRGPLLYREMALRGRLPLRVSASVREEQLERAIAIAFRSGQGVSIDLVDAHRAAESEAEADERALGRYRDGWLKLFSDGALGSRTAALLMPYELDERAGAPPGGPLGMALRTPERLAELTRTAAEAGIASQIHAIGDAAVRTALDVLAATPPVPGVRHRIEHAQLVHPDDLGRFAALGVAASVQPCHLLSDAEAMVTAWGGRSATAFALAALDAEGTLTPFGTDAPVEPPDPWRGVAAAVTRQGVEWPSGRAFHAEQRIGLARALRAACLDGPRSAGRTDEGQLVPGARADLIVLPAAPFDGAPDAVQLSGLRPLATLLDGEVVHAASDFDP
jgi:predicted amidohydrolase YtcJ